MAVARAISLRTIAFGDISGTFAAVGSPIDQNLRVFKVTNNTDGDMIVSLDGTTDNLFVPRNSFTLYDLSTNAPPISQVDNFPLEFNTQFYVRQNTAPTLGDVWIEGFYARGQ